MSQAFEIHSMPGVGTGILAEFWEHGKAATTESTIHAEAISLPIKGEVVCGDGWGKKNTARSAMFMVVDGLGHGIFAAEAAREAERIFNESTSDSPTSILQDAHDALKKTRGAAMATAVLNLENQILSFAGVGNIAAHIVSPQKSRGLASHNGTLGHQLYKIQEFTCPWTPNSLLIMHSDGLNTRWDLSNYQGIWSKHPGLISALLFRDFSRERDDVTVLVAKNRD
jgi:serine phosphatase RsbU (regulator of sigma subunit)